MSTENVSSSVEQSAPAAPAADLTNEQGMLIEVSDAAAMLDSRADREIAPSAFDLIVLDVLIVLDFQSNWDEVVDSFDDMQLREELLRGVFAYGFEKPSAIQQRAIMPCIKSE